MVDRLKKIISECEETLEKRGAIARFGRKIGVKTGHISEWLSGKAKPGADYRRKICEAYGINRDWLDTGQGEMLAASAPKSSVGSAQTGQADPNHARELEARLEALNDELNRCHGALDYAKEINREYMDRIREVLERCAEARMQSGIKKNQPMDMLANDKT